MTKKPAAPSQADKFRELARTLECDEDEKAFEEKVRQLAHGKPRAPKADKPK